MTTPIYGYPSPTLTQGADGPAAFAALAARVEREQTVYRGATNTSAGPGFTVGPNQTGTAVTWTVPLNTIGWVEVEATIAMASYNPGSLAGWAGFVTLAFDGVNTVTKRFHNNNVSASLEKTFAAKRVVTAAQTSVVVTLVVAVDAAASQPIIVQYSDLIAWQHGAPSSG